MQGSVHGAGTQGCVETVGETLMAAPTIKTEKLECMAFFGTGIICPHCRTGMEWVEEEQRNGNAVLRCAFVRCTNFNKLWQFPKVALVPFVK